LQKCSCCLLLVLLLDCGNGSLSAHSLHLMQQPCSSFSFFLFLRLTRWFVSGTAESSFLVLEPKKFSVDMLWICHKYFRDFVGSTALTHYSLLQNFELRLLTSKFWASSAQFCLFCFVRLSFTWANSSQICSVSIDYVVGLNFTRSVLFVWLVLVLLNWICGMGFKGGERGCKSDM